ncbi:hypothetical protein RSAG8_13884, partial [Rhizoctonia solani AG-8 WAC10335]
AGFELDWGTKISLDTPWSSIHHANVPSHRRRVIYSGTTARVRLSETPKHPEYSFTSYWAGVRELL